MNKEETRTLWEKGEDAWNVWALDMLQRKQTLEEGGGWAVDWFGEGQNPETERWLEEAKADFEKVAFAADASFVNFVFPGPALFNHAHFLGKADFVNANFANSAQFQTARFDGNTDLTQATFYYLANFDEVVFASSVSFEKAEFLRETTGPLVPAARFQKTQFGSRVDLRSSKFVGNAEFVRARFSGSARFDETEFRGETTFESAIFESTAGLVKARFIGPLKCSQTQFLGEARLGEADFQNTANFENAAFNGKVTCRSAKFGGDTTFQAASFEDIARFNESEFRETAIFRSTKFLNSAKFSSVKFRKAVDFYDCKFKEDADFEETIFSQSADFPSVKFKSRVSFTKAEFIERANFLHGFFQGRASFRKASFKGPAEFPAIQSRAPFVLSGSDFIQVPNFLDASFKEPPSLDHMTIKDPMVIFPVLGDENKSDPRPLLFRTVKTCGDPEYAARYRRLRKLAAETQDYEREREFFAQELRCRRYWHDKPFRPGLARFWIGLLYGGISDFGRSLSRPIFLWFLSVLAFSLIYLGQRRSDYFQTAPGPIADAVPIFPAWPVPPDLASILEWAGSAVWWLIMSIFNLFAGGGCIAGDSGATAEALFLSLKNSFFFLGWESVDASRRVYSCLYGFETAQDIGGQLVRVPLGVSITAIIQNIVGGALIVLFLLALRNLLRAR
jgi:uncharacterized protein YjbI with pentapeptide repeats